MVQEAITALGPLLAGAGGAFSKQGRREIPRQPMPSASAYLTQVTDKKQAKRIQQEADKERLFSILTQPEILGMLITIAGIYASQKISFSDDKLTNEGIQATATTASVLIGLGYAGVGDITTAIIAGITGLSSLSELIPDLNVELPGGGNWLKYIFPFGGLWDLID